MFKATLSFITASSVGPSGMIQTHLENPAAAWKSIKFIHSFTFNPFPDRCRVPVRSGLLPVPEMVDVDQEDPAPLTMYSITEHWDPEGAFPWRLLG